MVSISDKNLSVITNQWKSAGREGKAYSISFTLPYKTTGSAFRDFHQVCPQDLST